MRNKSIYTLTKKIRESMVDIEINVVISWIVLTLVLRTQNFTAINNVC